MSYDCPHCGRHRVEEYKFPDGVKHVCEKCDWCVEDGNYLDWDDYDYDDWDDYIFKGGKEK